MDTALLIPAFIAGILTFLAPCTLPLVPGYLGFVSAVSLQDLHDPEKARRARVKIFLNGLFFIIGWTLVFTVLGTLVGFVGSRALVPYRLWLSRFGGVFVIIFGLFMLNVIKIPFLNREMQFKPPRFFQRGRPLNSLILGAAFGFGWTPCVGPILGSILLLASTSTTVLQGTVLLAVFSLGLAIPFLTLALGIGSAARYVQRMSKYLNVVSVIGGIFLIALGLLLASGNVGFFIGVMYRLFNFINYDRLLNYL